MKKTLKTVSDISIILCGISLVVSKFDDSLQWNSNDLRSILVLIYLVTSLYYYKMMIKDKNAEIQELKLKLKNTNKHSP